MTTTLSLFPHLQSAIHGAFLRSVYKGSVGWCVPRAWRGLGAQSMLFAFLPSSRGSPFSLCLGEAEEPSCASVFLLGFKNKTMMPLAKSDCGSRSHPPPDLFFFFFFFWLHHTACRILAPRREIEPGPTAVEVQSPNHWTPREFPRPHFFPAIK